MLVLPLVVGVPSRDLSSASVKSSINRRRTPTSTCSLMLISPWFVLMCIETRPGAQDFLASEPAIAGWSDLPENLPQATWMGQSDDNSESSITSLFLSPSLSLTLSPLFVADSNGSRSNGSAYTSEFAALRTDLFFLYPLRHNLTSCSRLFLLNRFDVSALMALESREA